MKRPRRIPGRSPIAGKRAAWLALTVAALFFLYEFVCRVEPSLAVHAIAARFGLNSGGVGGLSSLFFWVYAPMQIVVGLVLDRYGARRPLLLGALSCGVGVLLFAATASPTIAGIGRGLTGFGGAFAFVGALYVVHHWFSPGRFALLSGAVNAVGMCGAAVGAVALTGATGAFGWRPVFLVTGIAGLAIFAAMLAFLRDAPGSGDEAPNPSLLGTLREIIGERRTWLIALIGLLFYMPVNVYAGLWANAELTHDHGLPPVQTETVVSMIFWGMAAGSVASGALSDAISHRKWLVVGGAALAAPAYAAAIYGPFGSFQSLSLLLFAAGFFNGFQMLTFAMAKEGHREAITGSVIAFVNMIGIAGALIFQPLVGAMVDAAHGQFGAAMLTIPGCLIAAALMTLAVREMRHPDHVPAKRRAARA